MKEANRVIDFFGANHLVNNPEKAAILYNSNGMSSDITLENIGEENIKSSYSEKLLGIHINSDFKFNTHVDKISIELRKRIGILKRIKQRVPKKKLIIIADSIFNSKIRYGVAVYLKPIFDKEELKVNKLPEDTKLLQTLQNRMIRSILGISINRHENMQNLRNKMKMFSVNQMCVYHTLLEAHNVVKNKSSEQIQSKWTKTEQKYDFRTSNDLKVPKKPKVNCIGFTYNGSKLFNSLPKIIKDNLNSVSFKILIKKWIWENIPSI